MVRTILLFSVVLAAGCADNPAAPVASRPADAKAADDSYITWEELLADDPGLSKIPIRGAGRMATADLNQDGLTDVVSAHADSSHIRVAWGAGLAFDWARHSLAEGDPARNVSDVVIADFSGDGWLDVAAASPSGHILYLENPAQAHPGFVWKRRILEASRGSDWTRVTAADLDGDGRPEIIAVAADTVAAFQADGTPLPPLGAFPGAVNAEAADLDGDDDVDLLVGFTDRLPVVLRNDQGVFTATPFATDEPRLVGDVMETFDFSSDGRADLLAPLGDGRLGWFEQPAAVDGQWKMHEIGSFGPDHIGGLAVGDVDGDGAPDVIAGAVSQSDPESDDPQHNVDAPSGRIAWFRNAGESPWSRHDILRRERGAFAGLAAADVDRDGATDLIATRAKSGPMDGVLILQQVRESTPMPRLVAARKSDSRSLPIPTAQQ